MNRNDKVNFVTDLSAIICKDIYADIRSGKIPEEWDGHELCALFADKAETAADISRIRKEKRGKWTRDYKNTIAVNNIKV